MSRRRRLRVVLLQVRSDPRPEAQEQECFLEAAGLRHDEMEAINLVSKARLTWHQLDGADALLIGGAGAHSATHDHDFTPFLEEAVSRAIDARMPVFGSCWGHHFLARLLGGELVTDSATSEVGTFEVELTEAGRGDPLFHDFPDRFAAQLGHHDRVATLPPEVDELAFSELCRNQALRLRDRPVYGTQFHSEMNEAQIRRRLEMYRERYLGDRAAEILDSFRPSPWADRLLRRFLSLYVS